MSFHEIIQILEDAVNGQAIGRHGNFWRGLTRDESVVKPVFGRNLIGKNVDGNFDPSQSNIVLALKGQAPFGRDIGTPGATIPQMPVGFPAVANDKIAVNYKWIENGWLES